MLEDSHEIMARSKQLVRPDNLIVAPFRNLSMFGDIWTFQNTLPPQTPMGC